VHVEELDDYLIPAAARRIRSCLSLEQAGHLEEGVSPPGPDYWLWLAEVRLARRIARFNRLGANRVQGTWAWLIPPWAVVIHRGRRSGRTYRTPVVALKRRAVLAIALPYGEDTDWVRNLLAAGGGAVIRGGRRRVLADLRVIDRAERGELPRGPRWLLLPTRRIFVARLESG
jgi:deazaflavin-dependent oxidoreductase (nitroreductase family)